MPEKQKRLPSPPIDPSRAHLRLIRCCDVGLSVLAIFLLFPLFAVIALLVAADSPGGVFFTQDRVGKNGQVFRIFKFRTMKQGGPPPNLQYRRDSRGRLEPIIKTRDSARITKMGRFLRKYSLDELPQFYNVIKGEMSLVGTRPPVPEEVEGYSPFQKSRLACKPGLTGLAQINGRSDMDLDEIVAYDLEYIHSQTIWHYWKILILTAPAFLSGRSSY